MAEAAPPDELELGAVLAAVALIVSAFPVIALGFSHRRGPYLVQTYLFWSDLPLLAVGFLLVPDLVRRVLARRLDIVTALAGLVVALAVAWAGHPSLRGAFQVLRFLGVAGAVLAVSRAGPTARRLLVGALVAFSVAEVAVAVAQKATGGAVGLSSVGELAEPLVPIGGSEAPQGTLVHPYLLAGLALVTIAVLAAVALREPARARLCALPVAVAGVAVGLTYSRAGLLGLLGILVAVALAVRSPRTRAAALTVVAAALIGAGVTALVVSDGWVGRAEEASAGTNLDRGRGELADQAITLIRKHPVLGVGTGRYVLAVEADREVAARSSRILQPVHVVPLLLVAEAGLLGLVAVAALAVALVRAAMRGGLAGWALLLGYAPFLLLDHFPATFPQGLVVTAAWLGTLELAATSASAPSATDPDPSPDPGGPPPVAPDLARPAEA
jgi:hypothetical protein